MKRKADYFVLFVFIIVILTFYAVFMVGQKDVSEIENRELAKIQIFDMKDFINKTYQDNLETAISDQIVISKPVKKKALEIRKDAIDLMDNVILKLRNNTNGRYYVAIAENTYKINDEDYLLNRGQTDVFNEETINYYNSIKDVEKYLYFIEIDRSKIYNKEDDRDEQYETILKDMEVTKSSKFNVPNYETHKEYFYKTDHHWNYKGQYKGYKEIANLLGIPENEQVKVTEKNNMMCIFGDQRQEMLQNMI